MLKINNGYASDDCSMGEAIRKEIAEMPYCLSAADSEKNDEQIYNTIKEIADSVEK